MSDTVRGFAILGAGIFAKEAYLPALAVLGTSAPPLKAVYSRSKRSATDLAEAAATILELASPLAIYHDGGASTGLDALLARSDIVSVIVVLPITLQPSIILRALAAGKHVLSEKPVAETIQRGLQLISDYKNNYQDRGLIWRIAENFEAEPGYRAAGDAIRAGKIGHVQFFRATAVNYIDKESKWYKTPWRTVPDYQGGFLLDGGVHTVAALRTMLPHPPTSLSGIASLNKDYLAPHDTIHAVIQAGPQVHGIVELSFASPTKSRPTADSFVITGSKGWLSVNQVSKSDTHLPVLRITIHSVDQSNAAAEEKEEIIEKPMMGVQAELASFFLAVNGKDDGLGLGHPIAALGDVAFIEAALNSGGNRVDLVKSIQL